MRSVKFLFSFNFSLFNQNAFSTTNKHSATRAPTDTHTPCQQQIQNHATFSVFHVFLFLFNALFDFVCCCFSNYNFFHLFVICILFSSKCERKFWSPIECFDWPTTTTNKNRWKNIYKNKNWWLDFDLFTQSWFISFDVAAERILLLRCGKKRMRNERKLVHLLLWSNWWTGRSYRNVYSTFSAKQISSIRVFAWHIILLFFSANNNFYIGDSGELLL